MVKFFLLSAVICLSSIANANIVLRATESIDIPAGTKSVSVISPYSIKSYLREVVSCKIDVESASYHRSIGQGARFILAQGEPKTKVLEQTELRHAAMEAVKGFIDPNLTVEQLATLLRDHYGVLMPTVVNTYTLKSESSGNEVDLRCNNTRVLSNDELAGQLEKFGLLAPVSEL